MNTTAVDLAIGRMSPDLLQELHDELRKNIATSHCSRLSQSDFFRRYSVILTALGDWRVFRDEGDLQSLAEKVGKRRFREGVPLGQLMLVLILIEKQLWIKMDSLVKTENEFEDINQVKRMVTNFFQKFSYYATRAYERELASESSQAIPLPARKAHRYSGKSLSLAFKEQLMEVSRGGQVAEFGG